MRGTEIEADGFIPQAYQTTRLSVFLAQPQTEPQHPVGIQPSDEMSQTNTETNQRKGKAPRWVDMLGKQ
ncbi:uncharacterized [Tachysurus ichikawai]